MDCLPCGQRNVLHEFMFLLSHRYDPAGFLIINSNLFVTSGAARIITAARKNKTDTTERAAFQIYFHFLCVSVDIDTQAYSSVVSFYYFVPFKILHNNVHAIIHITMHQNHIRIMTKIVPNVWQRDSHRSGWESELCIHFYWCTVALL